MLATAAIFLRSDTPTLRFDESVPSDLRVLANDTWDEFLASHAGINGCIGRLTLVAAWDLDSRAEYYPDTREAVVRVPGTPAHLRSEMIHEFAHHVEHTCPAHTDIRDAFMRAQGFSSTTEWFTGASWKDTPSEHYAEATVEYMLGPRSHHGNIFISEGALELVQDWASGSTDD